MAEIRLLEVGDVLYARNNYGIHGRLTIERVTPTQAISGSKRFRREYKGSTKEIGSDSGWNRTYYSLETPELQEAYRRGKLIYQISRFNDYKNLPTEVLEKIVSLLNSIPTVA